MLQDYSHHIKSKLTISVIVKLMDSHYFITMPRFLFQPDPIDGYEFNPIPIDIHLEIIKIRNEEILDDFGINYTDTVIVGSDRTEVLNWLQEHFARGFEIYGKLKESDIRLMVYETKQAWTRIRRHVKHMDQAYKRDYGLASKLSIE